MNKLLISAGVALSAAGLLVAAPARATTLSFGYQTDTSAKIGINPWLAGLTLDGVTIPETLDVSTTDVTGSFTVFDDITQVTDGDIELGYDVIGGVLGDSYNATLESLLSGFNLTSEQAIETVDNLFTVTQFSGSGTLTSESFDVAGDPNNPSPFNINYNNQTNTVVIDGYSNKVATSCFLSDCGITANVSYGVGLVISEFVTLTGELLTNANIELSTEASNTIRSLQQSALFIQQLNPSLETLELATVLTNISATTEFVSVNPPGSAADEPSIELTSGTLVVSAATNGEPEQIYSAQYGETPAPALTAENWNTQADTVVKAASVAPSLQASLTITADTPIVPQLATEADDTQDVPEPSILLGVLATVWAVKQRPKNSLG